MTAAQLQLNRYCYDLSYDYTVALHHSVIVTRQQRLPYMH
jgi:hypothetical protein